MSIYDEAKKKSNELTFPYNMFFDEFIERAKKVEELLGLYQSWVDDTEKDLWEVICQKEKELEKLK